MFEEYMQNLLGINVNSFENTHEHLTENSGCCMREEQQIPYDFFSRNSGKINSNVDLESMYPDIYKIVYPMVRKACMKNTRPITGILIDEITQDVYNNIEEGNVINLNISIGGDDNNNFREKEDGIIDVKPENMQLEHKRINRPMNDLIRILILREFIDRNNFERSNSMNFVFPVINARY